MMQAPLTPVQLEALASLSTPAIANAIETFKIRLRNEGYINNVIVNRLPKLRPMAGYAVTMRMRTDGPPSKGMTYNERSDWWDTIAALPSPKIMVIQDADKYVGVGSLAGEVHGAIFKKLGCIGIVTNGAVRDLDALEAMGLHVYSSHLCPSHAYAHIIDVGEPVELFGHTIKSGDLLHGDQHGIVNIPHQIAADLHMAALKILQHEREIIQFCASPEFSLEELRTMVGAFNSLNTGES
jgi:4-hydroxy-4-methyl-2-oxoglutarate aldolase